MLVCNNDGKGRHQSFTVWDNAYEANTIDSGYGATQEEAVSEYRARVTEHMELMQKVQERALNTPSEAIIKVDYAGKPIEGSNAT